MRKKDFFIGAVGVIFISLVGIMSALADYTPNCIAGSSNFQQCMKDNIQTISYQSNAAFTALSNFNALNSAMDKNYNQLVESVSHQIYPLILATPFSLPGTKFILYLQNGEKQSFQPTPPAYYE